VGDSHGAGRCLPRVFPCVSGDPGQAAAQRPKMTARCFQSSPGSLVWSSHKTRCSRQSRTATSGSGPPRRSRPRTGAHAGGETPRMEEVLHWNLIVI
jgi:hypothetical protein